MSRVLQELENQAEVVEKLLDQVKELEAHQLETSSLYREYKQLKSVDVEVKTLKSMHEQTVHLLTTSRDDLQKRLTASEKFNGHEREEWMKKVTLLRHADAQRVL